MFPYLKQKSVTTTRPAEVSIAPAIDDRWCMPTLLKIPEQVKRGRGNDELAVVNDARRTTPGLRDRPEGLIIRPSSFIIHN
jgi:hypothetical protein